MINKPVLSAAWLDRIAALMIRNDGQIYSRFTSAANFRFRNLQQKIMIWISK